MAALRCLGHIFHQIIVGFSPLIAGFARDRPCHGTAS
jgi:hypothetical protein